MSDPRTWDLEGRFARRPEQEDDLRHQLDALRQRNESLSGEVARLERQSSEKDALVADLYIRIGLLERLRTALSRYFNALALDEAVEIMAALAALDKEDGKKLSRLERAVEEEAYPESDNLLDEEEDSE